MTLEQILRMQGQGHYKPQETKDLTVVWSGGELLPDREEHTDTRYESAEPYGDDEDARPKRKYTLTGRYKKEGTDGDGLREDA